MFAAHAITALLALGSTLVVRADVTPSEPGPGDVFNVGSTCHITWLGDEDSTTVWKNMNIQLMTGSNFDMVHITTVATAQDGTVDGRFEYPCPEVTPNSAVYFYQFTSPSTDVKTWTTRFTLASATGATTPPSNPTQPGTNDPIPWGTGNLVDPSTAVAAPSGGSNTTLPSSSGTSTPVRTSSNTNTNTKLTTTPSTSTSAPTNTSTSKPQNNTSTDGALGNVVDTRVWMTAAAFVFAALLW